MSETKAYAGFLPNSETGIGWTMYANPSHKGWIKNNADTFLILMGYDPEKMKWRKKPKAGVYQWHNYNQPIPVWLRVFYGPLLIIAVLLKCSASIRVFRQVSRFHPMTRLRHQKSRPTQSICGPALGRVSVRKVVALVVALAASNVF